MIMVEDLASIISDIRQNGDGHVISRLDGSLARCGGPHLCERCKSDKARLDAAMGKTPNPGAAPDGSGVVLQVETSCGTCVFWQQTVVGHGQCRVKPPTLPLGFGGGSGMWPMTAKEDWCGDYRRKAGT